MAAILLGIFQRFVLQDVKFDIFKELIPGSN